MCSCAGCKYTDSFRSKGFAAWPRGNPTGPGGARREYAAHVAHNFKDARKSASIGPVGAAFYGGGKDAARTLDHAFRPGQREPEWLEFDWEAWAEDGGKRPFPPIKNPPAGLSPLW